MKRLLSTLTALAGLLATLGSVQAVPLRNLFAGGALTIGDKQFDQFTLNFAGTSDGHIINTSNIDVTTLGPVGLDPLNPGPGLRFSVLNNELRVTGDGVFAYADLQFGFRVSALDPGFRIKDNSMVIGGSLNRNADGNNDLGSYIRETIGTMPGLSDLATSAVEFSILNDILTLNPSSSATFAPQSAIWVTKNILVWSQDTTDTASLEVFEQRFSQAPAAVPEPAVLALLGIAALAAYLTRRRPARTQCSP